MRQEIVGHQVDLPPIPRIARLVEWRPWNGSTSLIGHCTIAFSGGWEIREVPIFRTGDGGISAGAPSIPKLDRDRKVRIKPDGKHDYSALSFSNPEARERWQSAVVTVVDSGIDGRGGE